jgi:hypothetical protein
MNTCLKVASLLILLSLSLTDGFSFSKTNTNTRQRSTYLMTGLDSNEYESIVPKSSSMHNKASPFFGSTVAVLGLALASMPSKAFAAPAAPSEDKYLDSLATLIVCKKVLESVDNYIEVQAYDNGRTNVNYLLNQLFLEKKVQQLIQQSLDFGEDPDAIDVGQEAGSRVSNTAIQLDSTLYTCNFIPADDGGAVPPGK